MGSNSNSISRNINIRWNYHDHKTKKLDTNYSYHLWFIDTIPVRCNVMSEERDYAIIHCDSCEETSKIEFEYVSDTIGITCPKCGSSDVWYRDIVQHDINDSPLVLGKGGALHTGKQT